MTNFKTRTFIRTRPSWDDYFLSVANVIATRSTCLRYQYGAVIVDSKNTIISTGYNGAPSNTESCFDKGFCYRDKNNIPSGTRYETCSSVHAEANAIIRSQSSVRDCTLYIGSINDAPCFPCEMCKRLMVNAGILYVCFVIDKLLSKSFASDIQHVRS